VCDANGGPVLKDFDTPVLAPDQGQAPPVVPDLNGSPYVVLEGGAMLVDFRNGDRRAVPSCAKQASEQTPDGKPRTIFYTPPADGLILRAGERGEVLGAPPAGARSCYTLDVYGRVVLAY
jgi:hypothetical protein